MKDPEFRRRDDRPKDARPWVPGLLEDPEARAAAAGVQPDAARRDNEAAERIDRRIRARDRRRHKDAVSDYQGPWRRNASDRKDRRADPPPRRNESLDPQPDASPPVQPGVDTPHPVEAREFQGVMRYPDGRMVQTQDGLAFATPKAALDAAQAQFETDRAAVELFIVRVHWAFQKQIVRVI